MIIQLDFSYNYLFVSFRLKSIFYKKLSQFCGLKNPPTVIAFKRADLMTDQVIVI